MSSTIGQGTMERKMNQQIHMMKQKLEIHEEEKVAGPDEDKWMTRMRKRVFVAASDDPGHKNHLINRVHSALREGNARSYEPIATSIGPYHWGKKHLLDMETHKKRYVRDLLFRNKNDFKFEDLVNLMKEREQQVRGCYPGEIKIKRKAFVEMMLLDGCFIVELLLKIEHGHRNDDLFVGPSWRLDTLMFNDLLLLENQLPFFLLQEIFEAVVPNNENHLALVKFSFKFLKSITENLNEKALPMDPKSVHHLLHLWHTLLIALPTEQPQDSKINLDPCLGTCNCCKGTAEEHKQEFWMPSVTQLEEAGVKFKASRGNLLDIKFCDGEMIIPTINVYDNTETHLRNLIAFEQCCLTSYDDVYYFTFYVCLLDYLINTVKDAEILHKEGILINLLGDDEEVARLFNKLPKGAFNSRRDNYLCDTYRRVNKYRSRKIHKWRASLVRNYFYSPWAIISVVAAIVALSLTAIQTTLSVLSSNNSSCQPK